MDGVWIVYEECMKRVPEFPIAKSNYTNNKKLKIGFIACQLVVKPHKSILTE